MQGNKYKGVDNCGLSIIVENALLSFRKNDMSFGMLLNNE